MQSQPNIVERVHRGDFTGLKFAGSVRLSFELDPDREVTGTPMTGVDINNREEQEDLCRTYVERRGGTYIGTYDEPDTSAWKKKRVKQPDGSYVYRVIRPVFEAMLGDLKKGRTESTHFRPADGFDQIVDVNGACVVDLDRLTRDHRHMEDAIETVQYFNRPIIDITGTLDLLTENGRDMARVMVTMAGKQSSATSRRGRDSHRARARRGIPVGGTRPFGWMEDKRTADPKESKLINDAATGLLDRTYNVNRLLNRWEELGVQTPRGNKWVRSTFIHMMTSPRMVGWRVNGPLDVPHHERYFRDVEGNPVKGQYDAIMSEDTWHEVVDLLTGPDRPGAGEYHGNLKYLCSGYLRCGSCGGKMRGNANKWGHSYICDSCRKVTGAGAAIDDLVTELILKRWADQQLDVEPEPWPGAEELAALEAVKAGLVDQFKQNPDMGAYIWPEVRMKEAAISKLKKERATYGRRSAQPRFTNLAEAWPTLDLDQKRNILAENFVMLILDPCTKRMNRFQASRLRVVYVEE